MLVSGWTILGWRSYLLLFSYLVVLLQPVLSNKLSSFGGYTVFYPRSGKGLEPIVNSDVPGTKEISGEPEILVGNYEDSIDSQLFLHTISTLMVSREEKYMRYMVKDDIFVISTKAWPMGWNHYAFMVTYNEGVSEDVIGEIEFTSLEARGSKKYAKVALSLSKADQGELALSSVTSYKRVSRKVATDMTDHILYYMKAVLREAHSMSKARLRQISRVKKVSDETVKERKKKALDRVIHPEKYKSKSGTVRRSNGGGSGRYTPSAEAQARRQVKRGG